MGSQTCIQCFHSVSLWNYYQTQVNIWTVFIFNLLKTPFVFCCRDAIENAGHLYNQVDELVHRLVMLSNKCTQELEFIMEFKVLEEGFTEVRTKALYLLL